MKKKLTAFSIIILFIGVISGVFVSSCTKNKVEEDSWQDYYVDSIGVKFHKVVNENLFFYLGFKSNILFLKTKGFSLKISGLILYHFSIASKGVFTLSSFLRLPCLRYIL